MRAVDYSLAVCSKCHLSVELDSKKSSFAATCPRCKSVVYHRKKRALEYTWALLITAIVMYIPANLLPIMHTDSIIGSQSDTIISGVLFFIATGSWPIALVIFLASVFIPLLKIVIMIYLLISVQKKSSKRKHERMKLYTLTEIIGRWSMVDVFVVGIMVALVQFKGLATIEAGLGAMFFALVVIFTMLAAMSFDSRLIWDKEKDG